MILKALLNLFQTSAAQIKSPMEMLFHHFTFRYYPAWMGQKTKSHGSTPKVQQQAMQRHRLLEHNSQVLHRHPSSQDNLSALFAN